MSSIVYEIKDKKSLDEVMNSSYSIVIIDIYADWCQPCKYLEVELEKIAQRYSSPNIIFTRLNVETNLRPNVAGLPSIEFWVNRKLFHTVVGSDVPEIQATLNKLTQPAGTAQAAATEQQLSIPGGPPPVQGYKNKSADKGTLYRTYGTYLQ